MLHLPYRMLTLCVHALAQFLKLRFIFLMCLVYLEIIEALKTTQMTGKRNAKRTDMKRKASHPWGGAGRERRCCCVFTGKPCSRLRHFTVTSGAESVSGELSRSTVTPRKRTIGIFRHLSRSNDVSRSSGRPLKQLLHTSRLYVLNKPTYLTPESL